jgi:4-amino-4-deoxy-L-arabinose transferase-like glycosyltransferase
MNETLSMPVPPTPASGPRGRTVNPLAAWAIAGCILLLAAVLRILPAERVFPAQGDASHFVQGGVAFHYGSLDDISGYWSIGPQFLAALAVRTGLDPARVLQASTIVAGVWLVFGVMFLTRSLTGSWLPGWLAGLLVASTPILVDSSTAGLAETPHMALALSGFAFWHHAFVRRQWSWAVAGGLLLALDLYYRPFDLYILLGVFVLFMAVRFRSVSWRFAWKPLLAGGVLFFLVGAPFFAITKAKQADSAAGSKLINLAFAEHGLNAKVMYGTKGIDSADNPLTQEIRRLDSLGAPRYLWANRGRIARNYVSNLLKAGRHLNSHAFEGGMRMGFVWFVLVSLGFLYGASRCDGGLPALYAAASIAAVPAALSIGFVHPRWILQCLPFYFLLAAMALAGDGPGWLRADGGRWPWGSFWPWSWPTPAGPSGGWTITGLA